MEGINTAMQEARCSDRQVRTQSTAIYWAEQEVRHKSGTSLPALPSASWGKWP